MIQSQRIDWHALAAALRGRHHDVLAMFYQEISPVLYALALRLVRDADIAHTIVAEAFAELWRQAQMLQRPEQDIMVWLIAKVRVKAQEISSTQPYAMPQTELTELPKLSGAAAARLVNNPIGQRLALALTAMPTEESKSLLTCYFMVEKDAALPGMHSIAASGFRQNLRRALYRLAKSMPMTIPAVSGK